MEKFQAGELLVASSMVNGTILSQGVCLLVDCDDDRVIGLMLNRPMQIAGVKVNALERPDETAAGTSTPRIPDLSSEPEEGLREESNLQDEFADVEPERGEFEDAENEAGLPIMAPGKEAMHWLQNQKLHFGGPLAGPLVALHQSAELAEAEAGDGIFVAATRDSMEALLQEDPNSVRLILGHLGWGTDVLANEVDQGIWHRLDASPEVVWFDNETMWNRLIRRATTRSVAGWIGAMDIPNASELN